MPMTREPATIDALRFQALRNALYHTARRRVLEGWGRWLNFLVIVGGAASVTQALQASAAGPWMVGIAITVVGALQLVFDFAGRARSHEILQRRYYDLLGRIEETGEAPDAARAAFASEVARIAGEEPPTYRALDAIAYNEALDALHGGGAGHQKCRMSRWQSLTRHWLHHNGADFTGAPAVAA